MTRWYSALPNDCLSIVDHYIHCELYTHIHTHIHTHTHTHIQNLVINGTMLSCICLSFIIEIQMRTVITYCPADYNPDINPDRLS